MLSFARTYGIIKANVYSASYYVPLSGTFFKKATPTGLNNFSVMQILQALRRAHLSLFCCISTAPQGGIPYRVALPLLVSTSADTGLSPLAKGLLARHKSSGPHPSFVTGRGELLWGQGCNSVLLGNSVCCATDAQPRTLFIITAIIFLLCLGLEEAWKQM